MSLNPRAAARLSLVALLALTAGSLLSFPGAAPKRPARKLHPPQDIILLVDVSGSMSVDFKPPAAALEARKHARTLLNSRGEAPPSDRESIRWDGVQFLIDIARDEDRIALVVFSGDAVLLTQLGDEKINPSGFLRLDQTYSVKEGKLSGRELLKRLVEDVQKREQQKREEPKKPGATQQGWVEEFKVNGKTYPVWPGTSSVQALRTVAEKGLLGKRADGREAWAFLFTDGFEEPPFEKEDDPGWKKNVGHFHEPRGRTMSTSRS